MQDQVERLDAAGHPGDLPQQRAGARGAQPARSRRPRRALPPALRRARAAAHAAVPRLPRPRARPARAGALRRGRGALRQRVGPRLPPRVPPDSASCASATPACPFLALTATATDRVRDDIVDATPPARAASASSPASTAPTSPTRCAPRARGAYRELASLIRDELQGRAARRLRHHLLPEPRAAPKTSAGSSPPTASPRCPTTPG